MNKLFKFLIPLFVLSNLTSSASSYTIKVINDNIVVNQQVDRLESIRLESIKKKGVLTVLAANQEPYSYKDSKTGVFSGVDADILSEVAKRLGAKNVDVRYVAFPNAFEELINNPEIDLLAQGLFITDERKKIVNFTNPIYTNQEIILSRRDSAIKSKEDLKNTTIGLIKGSVYEVLAQNWKSQGLIKDYKPIFDNKSLLISLDNKIVDAILTDSIVAEYSILMKPKSNYKILSPNQYKPEINYSVGYPLKKEDTALLNAINEKLEEMKNDGTIYEILVRYGITKYYIP